MNQGIPQTRQRSCAPATVLPAEAAQLETQANPLTIGVTRRASKISPAATNGPLARLSMPVQTHIAGMLTVREVLTLMWVSRDLARAANDDDRLARYREVVQQRCAIHLKLNEIHLKLATLPSEPEVKLQPTRSSKALLMRAASAAKRTEMAVHQAQSERDRMSQQLQVEARLAEAALLLWDETLEDEALRCALTQMQRAPLGAESPDNSRLYELVERGDTAVVGKLLDEFLAIPPQWLATERKVEWLLKAKGARSTLAFFAQYRSTARTALERDRSEAMRSYACSIAGSAFLSVADKAALLVDLRILVPQVPLEPKVWSMHLVHFAVTNGNPALAAAVLMGISESEADSETKLALIRGIAAPWDGDVDACLSEIDQQLAAIQDAAPAWVSAWRDGLKLGRDREPADRQDRPKHVSGTNRYPSSLS